MAFTEQLASNIVEQLKELKQSGGRIETVCERTDGRVTEVTGKVNEVAAGLTTLADAMKVELEEVKTTLGTQQSTIDSILSQIGCMSAEQTSMKAEQAALHSKVTELESRPQPMEIDSVSKRDPWTHAAGVAVGIGGVIGAASAWGPYGKAGKGASAFVNKGGCSADSTPIVTVPDNDEKDINVPNDRTVLRLGPFHRSMDKKERVEETTRILTIVTQMPFEHGEKHRIWCGRAMFGTEIWIKFPNRDAATIFKRAHGASSMMVNAEGKQLYLSVERYGLEAKKAYLVRQVAKIFGDSEVVGVREIKVDRCQNSGQIYLDRIHVCTVFVTSGPTKHIKFQRCFKDFSIAEESVRKLFEQIDLA